MGTIIYPLSNSVIGEEKYRDKVRLMKACSFLKKRRLLKDAAIKRLFANCWPGEGGVWDIDAFTMTGDKVVALEVKHKYPSKDDVFGINDGQKDLFCFLNSLGMPVVHIILQKPEKDRSIHAIDFLTDPEYIKRTEWLYTRFFPEKLSSASSVAPAYTNIYCSSEMTYKTINTGSFGFLKHLAIPANDIRSKLFTGIE